MATILDDPFLLGIDIQEDSPSVDSMLPKLLLTTQPNRPEQLRWFKEAAVTATLNKNLEFNFRHDNRIITVAINGAIFSVSDMLSNYSRLEVYVVNSKIDPLSKLGLDMTNHVELIYKNHLKEKTNGK